MSIVIYLKHPVQYINVVVSWHPIWCSTHNTKNIWFRSIITTGWFTNGNPNRNTNVDYRCFKTNFRKLFVNLRFLVFSINIYLKTFYNFANFDNLIDFVYFTYRILIVSIQSLLYGAPSSCGNFIWCKKMLSWVEYRLEKAITAAFPISHVSKELDKGFHV